MMIVNVYFHVVLNTVNYVMLFRVLCTSCLISCADDVIMVFPVHHAFPEQNIWNTGM